MGSTKSISTWPPGHLPTALTLNNANAVSEIPRILSGNTATTYGYVRGGDELDTDTINPAPKCPGHSLPGHDHSGGLFGRPLYRTIACYNFLRHDTVSGSAYFTANATRSLMFNTTSLTASSNLAIVPGFYDLPLWVPGGDPGAYGAYQGLSVSALFYVDNEANVQAGDVLKMIIKADGWGEGISIEVNVQDITTTGWKYAESTTAADRIPTNPGGLNKIRVGFDFTTDATVATRTLRIYCTCLEIGVSSAVVG